MIEAPEYKESAEFLRTEGVKRCFGIKRGTLYNLWNEKQIKGKLLRRKGRLTGVRIWDVQSIRDYINSQTEEPSEDENDIQLTE